ncbi:MAG: glycosyltransferase family 39 protein [Candidatus Omnitrophota bacterium]|jgi:4-amino-4-deoxy-L-arabinose transferase-like glycosyltransferase
MKTFLEKNLVIIALLVVLCSYLFFFRLGDMALTDPDETFYAQTAKEMLHRNDWVTPYLYGKPQFEKPALLYWMVIPAYKIFGINEFAARFPSALMGLIGVIAAYFLGKLLFNKKAAILSAVILATNVEYVVLSKACITDMALSTFMMLGALFFLYGYLEEKKHFYLLSAAAFALATLTKGPIAILLAGAAIIIFLLLNRDLKAVKKMPVLRAALVFLAIAAPWYAIAYKLHGNAFIAEFFGFRNITRFVESEHKIGSQFYYNIPILFGGFFPWSIFLPVGFWNMFKKAFSADIKEKRAAIFVLVWFFMIFIFFTISSTKLPTYIFPSFISAALIVGAFWDDFLKKDPSRTTVRQMKYSYYILPVLIIIGVVVLYVFLSKRYPPVLSGASVAGAVLALGFMLSLAAFKAKKYMMAFFFIIYALVLFIYPLSTLVLPVIERYETGKEISRELLPHMDQAQRLGSESHYRAGLAFYTGKFPVDIDKHHVLVQFLGSDERVWVVLKDKNHRQLYELDTEPFLMKPSYMVYKLGKKGIVTNRLPDDGKYILKRERVK